MHPVRIVEETRRSISADVDELGVTAACDWLGERGVPASHAEASGARLVIIPESELPPGFPEGDDPVPMKLPPWLAGILEVVYDLYWWLLPPEISEVYVQDVDTMDHRVDQVCVDQSPDVQDMRIRYVGNTSWDADWGVVPFSEEYEARGLKRICMKGIVVGKSDAEGFDIEVEVRDPVGRTVSVIESATCEQSPVRHVAMDGRGGDLALDLNGRPHVVSYTRRGLVYGTWQDGSWRREWIDCLDDSIPGPDGCREPDWTHDYGLQAGITLDFETRPVVCFVKGDRHLWPEDEAPFGDTSIYEAPTVPAAGEALITDAEIMLTPSIHRGSGTIDLGDIADMIDDAAYCDPPGDPRGCDWSRIADTAFSLFSGQISPTINKYYHDDLSQCVMEDPYLPDEITQPLGRQVFRLASVLDAFEQGGTFPQIGFYDASFPPESELASIQTVLAPGTSLIEGGWGGTKNVRHDRTVRADQPFVCTNDSETRKLASIRVDAEEIPGESPGVYEALPISRLDSYAEFHTATSSQREGLLDAVSYFEKWCRFAEQGDYSLKLLDGSDLHDARATRVVGDRGDPLDPVDGLRCVGCTGDADITADGRCEGCPTGRRAWRDGETVCVRYEKIPEDHETEPGLTEFVPFQYDRFGGVWHGCPAGPKHQNVRTIPIACAMDEQCSEMLGDDYRCHGGLCVTPVFCDPGRMDDDCNEGYHCRPGHELGFAGHVCQLDDICESLVGGVCLSHGSCEGVECEKYYTECETQLAVGGGGCTTACKSAHGLTCQTAACHLDEYVESELEGCVGQDFIQYHTHDYRCLERARLWCSDFGYCDPDDGPRQCPRGSKCSAGGTTNWCPLREMLADDRLGGALDENEDLKDTIKQNACLYSALGTYIGISVGTVWMECSRPWRA